MELHNQKTKLILVEPSGPLNIGSVARLCENFGIKELRLVAPQCDVNNQDARRMAVKGKKLLDRAKEYSCLIDAIEDCRRVIATSGRIDHGTIPLCTPEEAMKWSLSGSAELPLALVFGREDKGLTNQELLLAQKVLTIQTSSSYKSLNLSHAVAIVLNELQRCKKEKFSNNVQKAKFHQEPAPPKQIKDCLDDAEALLLDVGFIYEHTAKARMSKIKALLQRAEVQKKEISLIRGILRQMRWAINSQTP